MNLQKINQSFEAYHDLLKSPNYDGWRLWELVHQFQTHWDIDATNFREMFDKSFAINSPLWIRDHYYPKQAMQRYIDINDDIVRSMFKDLYNENKEIDGRISRFVYQCDEIYKLERKTKQKVLPHDHSDKKMIFIYLSFRYPEIYTLHDFPSFKKYLHQIGSPNPPISSDVNRYIKVSKTLGTLLKKQDELCATLDQKLENITAGNRYPMLTIYEIYNLAQ